MAHNEIAKPRVFFTVDHTTGATSGINWAMHKVICQFVCSCATVLHTRSATSLDVKLGYLADIACLTLSEKALQTTSNVRCSWSTLASSSVSCTHVSPILLQLQVSVCESPKVGSPHVGE